MTVKKVALNSYYNHTTNITKDEINISELIPVTNDNQEVLYYIVNYKNKGFSIISAENAMKPVLGTCSSNNFNYNDVPPGLLYLLERYKAEIIEIRKQKIAPSKENIALWDKYDVAVENFHRNKSGKSVTPMLHTKWGQGSETGSNSFNRFCPEYSTGNHCAAGCVAVAMAQVLQYWGCWVGETGSHSYWWKKNWMISILQYANFGNANYQWSSMDTLYSDDENAKLIYHCGVACEMNYSKNASSSLPNRAKNGLRDYFGFANSIEVKWRSVPHIHNWSLVKWRDMLKQQLDKGWPLIYSGGYVYDNNNNQFKHDLLGGHTWVIDGYNGDNNFYCNWGWNGNYNNGTFAVGGFDTPVGNFNQLESAIFNAWPTRTVRVGQPDLLPKNIYAGSNTLSVVSVEPASGYEWTTTHGTISGNGNSVILNTNISTQVCVRAINNQCNIHSNWDCETITVLSGHITGDNNVCTSNKTFTLHNRPSGSSVTWTKSNNLTYVSGQGTNSYTVKANNSSTSGTGLVKVVAKIGNFNTKSVKKTFWVGKPNFTLEGETEVGVRMPGIAIIDYPGNQYQGVTNVNWTCSGAIATVNGYLTTGKFRAGSYPGYGEVYANATNVCGSKENRLLIEVTGGWYNIYPNPANSVLTVEIEHDKMSKEMQTKEVEIRLYDKLMIMKKHKVFKGNLIRLNLNDLKPDVYILQLKIGDEIFEEKIMHSY